MTSKALMLAAALAMLACGAMNVRAAELRLLCPVAMRAVMPEIIVQFEKATGDKLSTEYATAGAVADRVQQGDAADVAIASTTQIDTLLGQGRIAAGTRSQIARVGIGVFVRAKAARPELTSVDSFRRTLGEAKAIGYGDPAKGGVSGTYMASLVDRLGMAADLKGKTKLFGDSQAVLTALAAGDIDIGIGLSSDTVLAAGVEFVAGLPAQIQNFTYYSGGVISGSKQVDAASSLVAFLTSPTARAVLTAKGFEPQ
jgi:molybdate transport system substrate-binding protein